MTREINGIEDMTDQEIALMVQYADQLHMCPRCKDQKEVMDITVNEDGSWLVVATCVKHNRARILGTSCKNMLAAIG
jgi:hypothetical protein